MEKMIELHNFEIRLPDGTVTTSKAYSVEHALHESGLLNSWYNLEKGSSGKTIIIITKLDEPETC